MTNLAAAAAAAASSRLTPPALIEELEDPAMAGRARRLTWNVRDFPYGCRRAAAVRPKHPSRKLRVFNVRDGGSESDSGDGRAAEPREGCARRRPAGPTAQASSDGRALGIARGRTAVAPYGPPVGTGLRLDSETGRGQPACCAPIFRPGRSVSVVR